VLVGFAAPDPPYSQLLLPAGGEKVASRVGGEPDEGRVAPEVLQLPLTRIARSQACAGCASLPAPRSDLSPQAGRGDLQQQSLLKLHAQLVGILATGGPPLPGGCRTFLPCPEGGFGSLTAACQRLAQAAQYRLIDKSELRHVPRLTW
jgi:hypothetical protein